LFLNIRVLELVIRVLKLIRGNILWVPLILVNPSIGTIGWLKVRILTNGLPEIRVLRGWWWSEIRVLRRRWWSEIRVLWRRLWWSEIRVLRVKTLLRKSTRGISGIMMIEMLLLRRRLKGCVVIRGWLLNLMRRESTILVWNRRSTQGFAEVVAMDIV
jgi:hypothetical protein